jgi:hypothetical protein
MKPSKRLTRSACAHHRAEASVLMEFATNWWFEKHRSAFVIAIAESMLA